MEALNANHLLNINFNTISIKSTEIFFLCVKVCLRASQKQQ